MNIAGMHMETILIVMPIDSLLVARKTTKKCMMHLPVLLNRCNLVKANLIFKANARRTYKANKKIEHQYSGPSTRNR